jgi:hypothetical protein
MKPKIYKLKHKLQPRVSIRTNTKLIGVRERSCSYLRVAQSIADLLWEPTQINHKQERESERERGKIKSQSKYQCKEHNNLFPEISLQRTYIPVEESTKDGSLLTLSLYQTVTETS